MVDLLETEPKPGQLGLRHTTDKKFSAAKASERRLNMRYVVKEEGLEHLRLLQAKQRESHEDPELPAWRLDGGQFMSITRQPERGLVTVVLHEYPLMSEELDEPQIIIEGSDMIYTIWPDGSVFRDGVLLEGGLENPQISWLNTTIAKSQEVHYDYRFPLAQEVVIDLTDPLG